MSCTDDYCAYCNAPACINSWIDMDYAAVLYACAQLQLAGAIPADAIGIIRWYARNTTLSNATVVQVWQDVGWTFV